MKALYKTKLYTITGDDGMGVTLDDIFYVSYASEDLTIDPTDGELEDAEWIEEEAD